MKIILLSGGSGEKLWPLSNNIRSKQFIKLFNDRNGQPESMIQRVYRQINNVFDSADVVVATSKSQASTVISQLGDSVKVSIEPERKGTFSASVLAMEFFSETVGLKEDEPIVISPVDLFVDDSFFLPLKEFKDSLNCDKVMLIGAKPVNCSERYGYILPKTSAKYSDVNDFITGCDKNTAEFLINRGALWNSGIYVLFPNHLRKIAHNIFDYSNYDDLFNHYENIVKISIEDVIPQIVDSLLVYTSDKVLNDLGTWNAITNVMHSPVIGNAIIGYNCKNVNVINDMDFPVIVNGLSDVVVSASQQGILVSKKEESIDLSEYVDHINNRVMFADKSWGALTVLDVTETSMTIKIEMNAGKRMSYHSHEHRDEMWTILSGHGKTIVDGMEQIVKPGDVITMQAGCRHTMVAEEDMVIIEIQRGVDINARDKKKYELE